MTLLPLSFLSLFHPNKQEKIIFLPFFFPLIFLSSKHTYKKYKSTLFLFTQFFPLNFFPSNFFPPIQTKPKRAYFWWVRKRWKGIKDSKRNKTANLLIMSCMNCNPLPLRLTASITSLSRLHRGWCYVHELKNKNTKYKIKIIKFTFFYANLCYLHLICVFQGEKGIAE